MESASSLAVRAIACLLVAVLLGGAVTGTAAAAETTSAGSVSVNSSDSLQTTLEETTDSTENVTDGVGTVTGDVTADSQDATENGTAVFEETTDETTDTTENATATTTDTVDDTVSNASEPVDTTVGETTETVDATVNNTTAAVDGTVNDTTAAVDETVNGTTAAVNETAEGTTGSVSDTETGTDETNGEPTNASASVEPPSTSEAATNAVLVGLLGAITASGAAASGASGAGASGATGGATASTASWLRHLRETERLRRLGADLWTVLPIFRYSRYDDSDPLEHDCREAIYETVRKRPGAYLSEVSDRTEVPLSTVRYHVRILEDEDLVTARKVNGKRRYFLEDDDAELHAALAEPAKREVLEAIADLGRAHNGRLAEALERDPSTVSHHLGALEEAGLVVREKDGRSIVNELPERVEAALVDDAPSDGESRAVPADD